MGFSGSSAKIALSSFLFLVASLVTLVVYIMHDETQDGWKRYFIFSSLREAFLVFLGIYGLIIFNNIDKDVIDSLSHLSRAKLMNGCSDQYSQFNIDGKEEEFLSAKVWSEAGIRFSTAMLCVFAVHAIVGGVYWRWQQKKKDDNFNRSIN